MIARRQTSIKVDPIAWDNAKEIFKEYNLTVADAINIFLNKVRLEGGLPFDMKVPSDRLQNAIDEVKSGDTVHYNSVEDMMKDLKA
ncbi:MAG: type II toxin-antitoxin system RelB/DinJ family antitoxin [Epsilonproteobacteria bacterium]|nr:type II toxin-antitoxin system RelB/DinJ family antitoxin [Campylobacterota bacterium]